MGQRYVIKCLNFFHLKGVRTNIQAELDSTLREPATSITIIKYWVAKLKQGRRSCQDEDSSNQPIRVSMSETVKKSLKWYWMIVG